MGIPKEDFDYICSLVHNASGIVLETGKEYLVDSRLKPLARDEGLTDIADLVGALKNKSKNGLQNKVIEAMTTNETSFYRDQHPFLALKDKIIPEFLEKRSGIKTINIWCAACSSGQEPYTIAMLWREHFKHHAGWKLNLLATDLSTDILDKAKQGTYRQLEINRGLPTNLLIKYFEKKGLNWKLKDEIRSMVQFRQLNLTTSWGIYQKMDIVFCRNVMIYFNPETKKEIFKKIRGLLKPDGYLFLGGAESPMNIDENLKRINFGKSGCYQIKPPS